MTNNIKRLRKDRKMTLDVLAKLIGSSKGHICELENSKSIPGVYKAMDIANALGVSVYAVFPHGNDSDNTKQVLGTLISWLSPQLGTDAAKQLLELLQPTGEESK